VSGGGDTFTSMAIRHLVVLVQRAAARVFHRVSVGGPALPSTGPVLVVANHQNSLMDPALLQLAAGRPVRFLAKAPLFSDPIVGPLVRGAGSIPVHRRQDGDVPAGANDDMFRSVHERLAAGDAIGIFPEGISHAEPRLAPLRTGAARIALGAAASGVRLTIAPVGIVQRDRGIFRSEVYLVRGDPVQWDDLAGRGAGDAEAVRELTSRISAALSSLIISFEAWSDQPQVELMDGILRAQAGAQRDDAEERVARWRALADSWTRHREERPEAHARLERLVRQHGRRLRVLRLTPQDLGVSTDWWTAVRWAARRVPLALFGLVTASGGAIAWVPYRLTGRLVAGRTTDRDDMTATVKAIGGMIVFTAWTIAWSVTAGLLAGWKAALLAAVLVPVLSVLALWSGEGWAAAWRDTRRFVLIRRHHARVAALMEEQAQLAELLRTELGGAAADTGAPRAARRS
jgi:glycerol-3-phosphate O-acyltransferase/dihydroxyacetone phosphate acyltransferase